MSKPSEYRNLRKQLDGMTLPTIDVSNAVMERIRVMSNRSEAPDHTQRYIKRRPKALWVMTTALFFVFSAAVSASVLPLNWNGERIAIEDDGGKNAIIDAFKVLIFGQEPTYKETIEDVLNNRTNAKEVMDLDGAVKQFPFTILRPAPLEAQPTRSNGVLMNSILQENGNDARIIGYIPVFYDLYDLADNRWAIVSQRLDQEATDLIAGRATGGSSTFIGKWEQIQVNDQLMAMYKEYSRENTLLMKYKNEHSQVIELKVTGTGEKDELIKLAKAYTGL
ncbi:hypothetical protein PCCS19_27810 [Paenibacillus sp. CCS19]|uniref:hypothetical protein n=1 Tax=Paenibacillus sp. CCS19 TaxID=3158387 RepID=UPI0025665D02|nr:hypothetical protein [Paenibacillus cellulosilyticus]GMK39726.1 hypothetical protein PCCS19_27810 [Paenibacillus cellulosilyticus]